MAAKLKGAVGAVVAANKLSGEAVKVVVRCRPLNKKELREKRDDVIKIDKDLGQISIKPAKDSPPDETKTFTFNAVYGPDSEQRDVYDETAFPLVEQVFDGYNGTIFAYGQTGCGKSWSMMGVATDENLRGIIPNAFLHIFERIAASPPGSGVEFLVRASYIEIYNEQVRDLLGVDAKASKDLKEDPEKGVYVKDLTTVVVKDYSEIEAAIEQGNSVREVGATAMNADSSRSHSIFTAVIETSERPPDAKEDDEPKIKAGKLNLVDLAGSERQAKTEAEGTRLLEATKINLSLSALGNVIAALSLGKKGHIPYRDSKLTRLLQDSLGGNAKTVMLTAVSPADYNFEETLSTLRYANRAKNIKNKPKINEDPKDALLRQFQDEIARLQQLLQDKGGGPTDADAQTTPAAPAAAIARQQQQASANPADGTSEASPAGTTGATEQDSQEAGAAAYAREQMQELLESERKERLAMEAQLQALKAKLLHSGDSNAAGPQASSLLAAGNAAAEHHAAVRERQRAELADEERLYFDEEFDDLSKEIASKSKKLKALRKKHKALVVESEEREVEFQNLGQDLMETVRSVTRDLALYRTIANAHVDAEVLLACEVSAVYDEEGEIWLLPPDSVSDRAGHGRTHQPVRDQHGRPGISAEKMLAQPLPAMGLDPSADSQPDASESLGKQAEAQSQPPPPPLDAMNQDMDSVRGRLGLQTTAGAQPDATSARANSANLERPKSRGAGTGEGAPVPRSRRPGTGSRAAKLAMGASDLAATGIGDAIAANDALWPQQQQQQVQSSQTAERQHASAARVVRQANAAASKAAAMLPALDEKTQNKAKALIDAHGTHDDLRHVHLAQPLARRNSLVKLWGANQLEQVATDELVQGRSATALVAAKLQLAPLSPADAPDLPSTLNAPVNGGATLVELQADTRAAALLRADRVRWNARSADNGEEVRQLRERGLALEEELATATVENAWLKEELRREKDRQKTENWEVALRMLKEQEEQSGGAAATVVTL
jgi:kinesin family protein 3/17